MSACGSTNADHVYHTTQIRVHGHAGIYVRRALELITEKTFLYLKTVLVLTRDTHGKFSFHLCFYIIMCTDILFPLNITKIAKKQNNLQGICLEATCHCDINTESQDERNIVLNFNKDVPYKYRKSVEGLMSHKHPGHISP